MVGQAARPGVDLRRWDAVGEGRLAEGRAGTEGVQGGDHRRAVRTEEPVDMLEHLVPAAWTEVEVDVGPIPAVGVQEAFEGQSVAQGIGLGQPQAVGDQAVGGRAATDGGDVALPREACDALDQEEVGREAELFDGGELVVEPAQDFGAQGTEAPACPLEGQLTEP